MSPIGPTATCFISPGVNSPAPSPQNFQEFALNPSMDHEIQLVATFADQAVIAIENVRLFEAEQQRTRELVE